MSLRSPLETLRRAGRRVATRTLDGGMITRTVAVSGATLTLITAYTVVTVLALVGGTMLIFDTLPGGRLPVAVAALVVALSTVVVIEAVTFLAVVPLWLVRWFDGDPTTHAVDVAETRVRVRTTVSLVIAVVAGVVTFVALLYASFLETIRMPGRFNYTAGVGAPALVATASYVYDWVLDRR